ncbi:hypothetical protein MMC26_007157 [Xylographa opegraphella]|nr:hypothetical protein [Xylographa opegraphella]
MAMSALPAAPATDSTESSSYPNNNNNDNNAIALPRTRSPASVARIITKNRRKRYLDLHPEYFSSSLELADPLAYDRLVRRFQTPAEREEEGRKKGYSGVLEADLWRSEAKVEALTNTVDAGVMTYKRGAHGEILAEERDEVPHTKEEGMQRWRKAMELRFLGGKDDEVEYSAIDEGEEYDDRGVQEREEEEKWFEEEEPRWIGDAHDARSQEFHREGETGVQDY